MWRALVFIGLLAVAAFGAVWLADRPGNVLITWGGYEYRTTVAILAIAAVAGALLLSLLWTVVRYLMQLPARMSYASRARRRARGYAAVSRGMVAVGSGDPTAARRHAGEAERLLGHEPLTLLLKAQAAQISGDRAGAESAFRRMADESETRVLGLRGLFVEAKRRGDMPEARAYAAEAARLAPAVSWANEAVLEAQSADGDWRGALATVERRASLGLLDKASARRHRAVLLTADALARQDPDPDGALNAALDAVKLAPDLVPAATVAGRLLSRRGDLRRGSKIVEAAWKLQPHPDLADVYLDLRIGDSTLDRLRRAETLARLSSWDPEARLAVARAGLEARDFARAREALRPLLTERPTVRACLLMADIEQAEHGATGQVREWLARAVRSPRDPVWIADGVVSESWAPVSPITGRLDAFVWQAPPDLLTGPGPMLDDVVADLDDKPAFAPAIAAPVARAERAMKPEPAEPSAVETSTPIPTPVMGPVAAPKDDLVEEATRGDPARTEPAAREHHEGSGDPTPVIFPVPHAPDDPGPEGQEAKPRLRFFG